MSARKGQGGRERKPAHPKRPQRAQRNLILVLGMHRSGTSALTGALGKLGVELGEELLESTDNNPKGYFENARVVAAQELLFDALRQPWHDPRALPDGWSDSSAAGRARDVLSGVVAELFAHADVVAVKDPRSCRVVPLWREVAARVHARAGAVLMVRHPSEVATSLQRRDGLSRSRAHLLWIRYLLDAERATRGMPRAFVSYEALLEDWRGEIGRIGNALGVALAQTAAATEIDQFLDASLRNHTAAQVGGDESPFASLAMALYALALRGAVDPGQVSATEFDAIAANVEKLAGHYFDAVEDCIAIELPLQMQDEMKRQGRDKARIDMALQLAALRELWRPAMIARAPGACKLYYREHSTKFIEARAVSAVPVALDDGLKVVFKLPAGSRVDHLRIDPDEVPGVFAVRSLSVGGVVIADLANRVTLVNELELPSATQAMLRFAALGEDPYFELDMRGCAQFAEPDGPALVELRYRSETVASELGAQVHDVGLRLRDTYETVLEQQRGLTDRVASTASEFALQVETLQQRLAGIDERATAFQTKMAALSEAMRAAVTSLQDAADQARDAQCTRIDRLGAEAVERDNALAVELAAVREHQATLLHWALRRSPRYWWRRLLGRRDRDGDTR